MNTQAGHRHDVRRTLKVAAVLVLVALLLLLMRISCSRTDLPPEPKAANKGALLVPAEMADRFGLEADQIVTHCRQSIHAENYDGILRGAYGALWTGRGNSWDRTLLAADALRSQNVAALIVPGNPPRLAIPGDGQWTIVGVDSDRSEVVTERPQGAVEPGELAKSRPDLFHTLRPTVRLLGADGKSREISVKEASFVADWVYRPVVLEAKQADGGVRYSLRSYGKGGPQTILTSPPLKDVQRAELDLAWSFGKATRVWKRELFDRSNAAAPDGSAAAHASNTAAKAPGQAAPRDGDRYAIVVALGPVVDEVARTRTKMTENGSYTPLPDGVGRNLLQMGTRYFIDSDRSAKQLAEKTGVRVQSNVPRIVIAAYEPLKNGKTADPAGFSLDVLADEVIAVGEQSRQFHVARGLAGDLIESHVLHRATKLPVVSASTVFARLKSSLRDTPRQRIALIRAEGLRMLEEEPVGTRMRLTGLLPDYANAPASAAKSALFIERTNSGLVLHGVAATEAAKDKRKAAALNSPPYVWGAGRSVSFGKNADELAVVADAMLAHRMNCADYRLDFELLRALSWEPIPLTAGCVVSYRVTHRGKQYHISVPVFLKNGRAAGKWLTIPAGQRWVSTGSDNYGDVTGAWPEVVGVTPKGPSLEAFLGSDDLTSSGKPRKFRLQVGTRKVSINATQVAFNSRTNPLIEIKSGKTWQPAVFVRNDGLISRRSGRYEVRPLGAEPNQTTRVSAGDWRRLQPMEMKVDGRWAWVNVLERKPGSTRVQICDSEKPPEWADAKTLRPVQVAEVKLDGKWRAANVLQRDDAKGFRAHVSATDDAADRWFAKADVRLPQQEVPDGGTAVLLDAHRFPLLLAWKRGETSLVLQKITPVVTGKVTDGRTGLPVAGATLTRSDGKWKVRSAADGSFGIPVDDPLRPMYQVVGSRMETVKHPGIRGPRTFQFLVIADRSAGPRTGNAKTDAERDRAWQQQAAKTVKDLIGTVAYRARFGGDSVRIGLWTFPPESAATSKKTATAAVTEVVPLSGSTADVLAKLNSLQRGGNASLNGAITHLARSAKLPKDLIVILISSGRNSETSSLTVTRRVSEGSGNSSSLTQRVNPSEIYKTWKCEFPIHVFELRAGAAGPAAEQLRELALVSGGTCETVSLIPPKAGDKPPASAKMVSVKLRVEADGFATEHVILPISDAGKTPVSVTLGGGCPCKQKTQPKPDLLVIGKATLKDLSRCDGLSAKGRRLVEDRVRDGRWIVTIPNRRVNIAGITAYAWFETELATGRMIGRTEDGLHGAVPSPRWPSYRPRLGVSQPFVAWFEGLTAYTTGSVLSAMRWHKEPGFPGSPEDFKRFVQANALQFSLDWWQNVASTTYPGMGDNYWSGVCMNFTLQSAALRLPSTVCHRRWGEDLCSRLLNAAKDKTLDELKEIFNSQFKKEWQSFAKLAGDRVADEAWKRFEDRWNNGVKFTCSELMNSVLGKQISATR